jgi:thiol-disulfide isomerase/thioredoxin
LRTLITVLAVLLLPVCATATPSAQDHWSCGPDPINELFVAETYSNFDSSQCHPGLDCWEPLVSAWKKRSEQFPQDVHVQEGYNRLLQKTRGPEALAYKESVTRRAAERSQDASLQYLSAVVGPWEDQLEGFTHALKINPSFAPAYLARADRQRWKEVPGHGTIRENAAAYRRLCPTRTLEVFSLVQQGDSLEEWQPYLDMVGSSRHAITEWEMPRGIGRWLTALQYLQMAEATLGIADPEALLQDLQSVKEHTDGFIYLDTAVDICRRMNDEECVSRLEEEILQDYPCSFSWSNSGRELWKRQLEGRFTNRPVKNLKEDAELREYFTTLRERLRVCPTDLQTALMLQTGLILERPDIVQEQEVTQVTEDLLELWQRFHGYRFVGQGPHHALAVLNLHHGRPEVGLSLIHEALVNQLAAFRENIARLSEELEKVEAWWNRDIVRAETARAEALVGLGRHEEAAEVLVGSLEAWKDLVQWDPTRKYWDDEPYLAAWKASGYGETFDQLKEDFERSIPALVDAQETEKVDPDVQVPTELWYSITTEPKVPNFSLPSLAGERVTQDVLGEGVCLVNFWAEWCGPCRADHQWLPRVAEELGPDACVLTIGTDQDSSVSLRYIKEQASWIMPTVIGGWTLFRGITAAMEVEPSLPLNVITRNGRVVADVMGCPLTPDECVAQFVAAVRSKQ